MPSEGLADYDVIGRFDHSGQMGWDEVKKPGNC